MNVAGFQYQGAWTGDTSNMPTLAPLSADPLLVDGSLALLDPSDSANPWIAGVPAPGVKIPNLAWDRASPRVGGGDDQALAFTWNNSLISSGAGQDAIIERTAKGGLHVIVSQVANAASDYAQLDMAAAIKSYILANPGHSFYASCWFTTTRRTKYSGYPQFMISNITSATGNYLMFGSSSSTNEFINPGAGVHYGGSRVAGNTGGLGTPTFKNISTIPSNGTSWSGTIPSATANLITSIFPWANAAPFNGLVQNQSPSYIAYRWYFEDLTVSGRPYATVDAIDFGLYSAAFSSGGRFNADTYTNPSILP